MADKVFSPIFGVDQVSDELLLKDGFAREIRGFRFKKDDPTRLWLMPGRTQAGTAPSTTNLRDLFFVQYEDTNYLAAFANGKLYITSAAVSLGSWAAAQDQQGTPSDFTISGSCPKALHDGADHWVFWGGESSRRPLTLDTDGVWRYLGLVPPDSPILNDRAVGAGSTFSPDSSTAGSGSYTGFNDPSAAYDTDEDTFAYKSYSNLLDIPRQTWEFTDAGNTPADCTLDVLCKLVRTSFATSNSAPEIILELSEDGGTSFTEFARVAVADFKSRVTVQLSSGVAWTDIQVRATVNYTGSGGTLGVWTGYIYEIKATTGPAGTIAEGTYYYAVTEVVSIDDGRTLIESAPGEALPVDIAAATYYNVVLSLPSRANTAAMGIPDAKIYRRIYRSTASGVYPNLGLIGTADIDDTTFTDNFDTSGETLGSPTIETLNVLGVDINRDSPPPPFKDATLYKGAIVAIPADDPYRIQWCLPGRPGSWPIEAHDLVASASPEQDKLEGIVRLTEETFIVFATGRVIRVRNLPFAGDSNFNPTQADLGDLTQKNGLAAPVHGYETFQHQQGFQVVAWISHNGIWMSDGTMPDEEGMGVVKLSQMVNWEEEVQRSSLSSARLQYDPETEILWFHYTNSQSERRCISFFVNSGKWFQPEGQPWAIPAFTGPHPIELFSRAIGYLPATSKYETWGLELSNGKIWLENSGTKDNAQWLNSNGDIEGLARSGWIYPFGPYGEWVAYKGQIMHNNWGPGQACQFIFEARRDESGIHQILEKNGVSLRGSRVSSFWLSRGGQSYRHTVRFVGQTSGAIGPVVLELEDLGRVEGD